MHVDCQPRVRSTTAASMFFDDWTTSEKSGMPDGSLLPLVLFWTELLSTAPDAAELQIQLVRRKYELERKWATADEPYIPQDAWHRNIHVDACSFEVSEQSRLMLSLHASFEAEPLEDGMDHPADEIIRGALRDAKDDRVFHWIKESCLDAKRSSFAASVLRCVGRQMYPGSEAWRTELVRCALDMEDVEIRGAAIQAAEFWGGPDICEVLKAHDEPLQWLRNYVRDVIEDLREQGCSWLG